MDARLTFSVSYIEKDSKYCTLRLLHSILAATLLSCIQPSTDIQKLTIAIIKKKYHIQKLTIAILKKKNITSTS